MDVCYDNIIQAEISGVTIFLIIDGKSCWIR